MGVFLGILAKPFRAAAIGAVAFVAPAQAQDTINFMSPNDSTCAVYPQFVSLVLGYWDDLGLKVNMLSSETSIPYVAFLQNGDADVVTLDSAQVLQAVDTGLPIKVLYEAYQFAPEGIVVLDDSPIKSLSDLKNVTVGMASDRDLITTVIALDSVGETVDSAKVTSVVVGDSGPVMATALQNNTVQAFVGGASDRAGIEAAGVKIRNITPPEVSRNPGNSFAVWGPTMEEKRDIISRFLKGWAMGAHAGVLDTKTAASACRTRIPEQFENLDVGMRMINGSVYERQLRRTKDFGELQRDVWQSIQAPYVRLGEISKELDISTFLDSSFNDAANDFTTDDVKKNLNAWREANADKLIN